MCQDICEPVRFKFGMVLNTTRLQFDYSLNDFNIHSRSQVYGKGRTCAVILLQSCMKQLKCSRWLDMYGLGLKKSCKYSEYTSSEHLLFLFISSTGQSMFTIAAAKNANRPCI